MKSTSLVIAFELLIQQDYFCYDMQIVFNKYKP